MTGAGGGDDDRAVAEYEVKHNPEASHPGAAVKNPCAQSLAVSRY
jgi:hypothetical protein